MRGPNGERLGDYLEGEDPREAQPPAERRERSIGKALGRVQLPPQTFGLLVGFSLGVLLGALTDALSGLVAVAVFWLLAVVAARRL